jgi:hypothetical protein
MNTLVRIIKNWDWPDLMRQTPGCKGEWDGIRFRFDPVNECDYTIVLNHPDQDTKVICLPQHVWAIMQEPPTGSFFWLHRGDVRYWRIYTSDDSLRGPRYIHAPPALPWHVNKDYDYLTRCSAADKERELSWITSNKAILKGHQDRMEFLYRIQDSLDIDVYGRGLQFIDDKWDALAPYRYSLAIENFRSPYYWSEKLADCFLSWTMPIYYGCTRISEFFPKEAMVCIDIHDPHAPEMIREAIARDLWRRNLDAIAEARRLVLDKYQLFPFIAGEIQNHERGDHAKEKHIPLEIALTERLRYPLAVRVWMQVRRLVPLSIRKKIRGYLGK